MDAARANGGLLRPTVLGWYLQEARRRARLRHDASADSQAQWCDTVLLGYPRSGSHLVRHFAESITGRPTLGEGDDERRLVPTSIWDRPIGLRPGTGLELTDPAPILVKRHQLADLNRYRRLILLVRDPMEVLVRHGSEVPDDAFASWVQQEARLWKWQLRVYDSWDPTRRHLVNYRQLASGDRATLAGIADFLGHPDPDGSARQYAQHGWGSAYAALQDAPMSRGRPLRYWQDEYPERAAEACAALLRSEILPEDRLAGWLQDISACPRCLTWAAA